MKYDRTITLKNGAVCRLRNAEARDGQAVLGIFNLTHGETDYLLSYPDECTFDAAQESRFLAGKAESGNEIEIVAEVNGEIAGTAGIDAIGSQYKLRHRAEFGIGIARKFWGQGDRPRADRGLHRVRAIGGLYTARAERRRGERTGCRAV